MASVTYTAATAGKPSSFPPLYPFVVIPSAVMVGEKETRSTAHPPASSFAPVAGCHSNIGRAACAPVVLTPVVNYAVIPAAYMAPRGYRVYVGPHEQLRVFGSSMPVGSATCKAAEYRGLEGEEKKSRASARTAHTLEPANVVRGLESSHGVKSAAAKRGHLQRFSQVERYALEDAEGQQHGSFGYGTREHASQRGTPAARGRNGHDLSEEVCAGHVHLKNAKTVRNVPMESSRQRPRSPSRKLKFDDVQRKTARNHVRPSREWALDGQVEVEGTVELL